MSPPSTGAAAPLTFELLTLFPEFFDSVLAASLLGKAITGGLLQVNRTQLRDFGLGRHKSVDDSPYGGGPAWCCAPSRWPPRSRPSRRSAGPATAILLSPQGRPFTQAIAADLAQRPRIMLVCGRYEGFDERVPQLFAHDILSIGDFVLSGGEVGRGGGDRGGLAPDSRGYRQERVNRRRVLLHRPAGVPALDAPP